MNRAQYSQIFLMVLVSVGVWAAHGGDSSSVAAQANAKGAYAVTFHVLAPSTVPDGATVVCKANVTTHRSIFDRLSPEAAPFESAQGTAKVVGSAANCTVQLPALSVSDSRKGAALSYRIDAFTSTGPAFLRTQKGIGINAPKPGETANLNLKVSL